MIKYTKFNSPIGTIRLYFIEKVVYFISLPNYNKEYIRGWFKKNFNSIPEFALQSDHPAIQQILEFLTGKRKKFNLLISHLNTEFGKKVLNEVIRVPYGDTTSYKNIAKKVGNVKASRAVGTANAGNPLPLVIPCHRIISHNGNLGGYGGGINIKEYLLSLEHSVINGRY